MRIGRLPGRSATPGYLLGILFLFSLASRVDGGEKIKFSDPNETIELPDRARRGDPFDQPLDFNRKREDGGSLAPVLPSPTLLGPPETGGKPLEKTWFFNSNGKLDHDAALKRIFKIRDYDLKQLQKTPGSEFDKMFGKEKEESNRPFDATKKRRNGETNDSNSFEADRRDRFLEQTNSQTGRIETVFGMNRGLAETPSLDPLARIPGQMDRNPFGGNLFDPTARKSSYQESLTKPEEQDSWSKEFQKMFGPRPTLDSSLAELLRNAPDPTRQQLNPLTGRRLDDSLLGSKSSLADPLGTINQTAPRTPFSSSLESFNSKQAGSSLTPMLAPPTVSIQAPASKPPTFEIPRRKF